MLEVWHVWVIAGLVLWIIEMFTPGFVVGVFGTACLIVAPFAGAEVAFEIQLLIFAIATAAMSFGIRPLILRHFYSGESQIKTNVDALVGKAGPVTETIDNALGTGRAKIGGDDWRAVTADDSRIDVGQKVTVLGIDGAKLVVEATTTEQGGTLS